MLNQLMQAELTLSNFVEVESSILVAVSEIQNSQGHTLVALHHISQYLNNLYKECNLVLANVFFNDFIVEAHRNGTIDEANANVTDAIERFIMIKEIAAMFEDAKESIEKASGEKVQFNEGHYTAQIPNDPELAIKVGITLQNIAELTTWAYLEEQDKFSGQLIEADQDDRLSQAVSVLKEKGSLSIVDKAHKDFVVSVKQEHDSYKIELSRPIKRAISLHMQAERVA